MKATLTVLAIVKAVGRLPKLLGLGVTAVASHSMKIFTVSCHRILSDSALRCQHLWRTVWLVCNWVHKSTAFPQTAGTVLSTIGSLEDNEHNGLNM